MKYRTNEEFLKVMTLRKKGTFPKEISILTGIPLNTINGWVYRGVACKENRIVKDLKKGYDKLDNNLAYIIGVLLGDGCLSKSKRKISENSYSHRIILTVTDKDFALKFKEVFENWSGLKPTFFKETGPSQLASRLVYKNLKKRKNLHHVVFENKKAYIFLGYFIKKELNKIYSSRKEVKINFLRGLYDSEGSVVYHSNLGRVMISMTDYKIMRMIRKLLYTSVKIRTKIGKRGNGMGHKDIYFIFFGSKKAIKSFSKIGFCIERKRLILNDLCEGKGDPNLIMRDNSGKRRRYWEAKWKRIG